MTVLRTYVQYMGFIALIGTFIYILITGMRTSKEINGLHEDVEEIIQKMLIKPDLQNGEQFLMLSTGNVIKRVLSRICDELHVLKKAIKGPKCPNVDIRNLNMKIRERVNYASENLGAKVISVEAEPLCEPNFFEILFRKEFWRNPPEEMLRSNMAPGNCFGFKIDRAIVIVKLPQPVLINQVGIHHISERQSPTGDTCSAPKDFTIFALTEHRNVLLGEFRYEVFQHKLLQTFDVYTIGKYDLLKIHFNSNHGHSSYTCVYRIVVYGKGFQTSKQDWKNVANNRKTCKHCFDSNNSTRFRLHLELDWLRFWLSGHIPPHYSIDSLLLSAAAAAGTINNLFGQCLCHLNCLNSLCKLQKKRCYAPTDGVNCKQLSSQVQGYPGLFYVCV
uniref:SUN domain-containing protein n=1 Tax=Glossina palpalis gambiensis TaxID=67801 RepID=A0A1B0BKX2_9MUSC